MAFDIFLKFAPAIDGGSMHEEFRNYIDVESFSWGVANPQPDAKQDLPAVQHDLSVAGRIGVQSPKLFEAAAKGTNFASAELVVVNAGQAEHVAYRLRLTGVTITSYQTSGSGAGEIHESYSLSYRALENVFQAQKPDGTLGQPITGSHDFGTPPKL